VWPGDISRKRWAVQGDWLNLPLEDSSLGLVVGDGSLNCLRYPEGYHSLARAISRALHKGGAFVLRCFVQPYVREAAEGVLADAMSQTIPTFNHCRFRLLMAMQECVRRGVCVSDVYDFWASRQPNGQLVNGRPGWAKQDIDMIRNYRNSRTVHTFPTLVEWSEVLCEFFENVSVFTPSYYCGNRCPTLVMRPRHRSSLKTRTR